jgi:hypothetical protein
MTRRATVEVFYPAFTWEEKENCSWKASSQQIKHGFTSLPQSQKDTPLLGNILIHPLHKKIEPSAKKKTVNHILGL